jgi:uncharacterized membrane protein
MNRSAPKELFDSGRLLAFSDGVFGVAITLLVIDIHLPANAMDGGDAALLQALAPMGPKLVVFAFTFIVLGMSWLGHHRKFSYIDKVDGRLLWINLFYLMAICLVPFVSNMLAEDGNSRFAFALYAGVMALTDMVSTGLSAYGLRKPFLRPQLQLRPVLRRDMVLSPLLVGIIFVVGAAISLGGWVRLAHWTLFMILPVMALLGSGVPVLAGLKKS